MAFRKKSEDPWDIDPKQKKKAVGPSAAEEQELTPPPWVRKKTASAPVACPWCGKDMVYGTLFATGRSYGMTWEEGEKRSFLETLSPDPLRKKLDLGRQETAWYCTACRKLTLDIETAMKTAGPRVVWKGGKPIPQGAEEEETDDL